MKIEIEISSNRNSQLSQPTNQLFNSILKTKRIYCTQKILYTESIMQNYNTTKKITRLQ